VLTCASVCGQEKGRGSELTRGKVPVDPLADFLPCFVARDTNVRDYACVYGPRYYAHVER
jgi:hypothetical protein